MKHEKILKNILDYQPKLIKIPSFSLEWYFKLGT